MNASFLEQSYSSNSRFLTLVGCKVSQHKNQWIIKGGANPKFGFAPLTRIENASVNSIGDSNDSLLFLIPLGKATTNIFHKKSCAGNNYFRGMFECPAKAVFHSLQMNMH